MRQSTGQVSAATKGEARDAVSLFFRVPSKEIHYLKYIMEGYEDWGIMRTVETALCPPGLDVIEVMASPDFVAEVRALAADLEDETGLVPCEKPADYQGI